MVDALKRASAEGVTVVAPFLGFSRQDTKHRGRGPISEDLHAAQIHAAAAADHQP